jgi:glycine oxidase
MKNREDKRTDVLVVGGGVIGLLTARQLDEKGIGCMVLEREEPGHGATWASAGMIAPQAEARGPGPGLVFATAGRQRYPALARALAEETGVDVELRKEGALHVAISDEDEGEIEDCFRWQEKEGLEVEFLDGGELLRREPALSPGIRSGVHVPGDIQVSPRRLVIALRASLERRGVPVRTGEEALRVLVEGDRATGIESTAGEIRSETTLLCSGAWAGRGMPGVPPLPVRPVRGQILALGGGRPAPIAHCVHRPGVYLVPRHSGETWVGATMENAGFRVEVTAGAVADLLARGIAVVPALAREPVREWLAGLRPDTPDHLPLLGPWGPEGLHVAVGHFRQGIATAPVTAELMAEWIETGRRPAALEPFDPALRFSGEATGEAAGKG